MMVTENKTNVNPREVIRSYIDQNGQSKAQNVAAEVYAYTVIDCDPVNIFDLFDGGYQSLNYDPDIVIFDGIDEIAELYDDNPADLARAIFYGDVTNIDGPLYFDAYGNIRDAYYEDNQEYAEAMLDEDIHDALIYDAAKDDWDGIAEIIRELIDAGENDAAAQLGTSVREYAERLAKKMIEYMTTSAAA